MFRRSRRITIVRYGLVLLFLAGALAISASSAGADPISAGDLGTMLENDPNYHREPVRLFSCETGQGTDPYAQELADRLGVDVSAPDQLAWADMTGSTFVTSMKGQDIYGRPIPNLPPDGQWRVFHPRKGED